MSDTSGAEGAADPRFSHATYTIRRKVLKLVGGSFSVFDPSGNLVLYSEQKGFKLKEDIRIFGSQEMTEELVRISARQAMDFSGTYDVIDSRTGQAVGALQRKGLKSMVADEWRILDVQGNELGLIKEDQLVLALIRRFLVSLLPQKFTVEMGGQEVATISQMFNPIVQKLTLDFGPDPAGRLDRRLGLAAGILLCAIEGRQGGG